MIYVFADNFRGFSNTLVPLKDVNFFVGENSSGKTSLMALARLMSAPGFWLGREFNVEDVELGNFWDIVSEHSSDKSWFRVGRLEVGKGPKGDGQTCKGFLMTFREKKGMPVLSRYTSLKDGIEVNVALGGKVVSYKWETGVVVEDTVAAVKELFLRWCAVQGGPIRGYKRLKGLPETGSEPILFLGSRIEYAASRNSRSEGKIKMYEPREVADMVWLAPIRTRSRRTYESYKIEFSAEGSHTPYLIRELLSNKKAAKDFSNFMGKFGRDSGLFEGLGVKNLGRGALTPFQLKVSLTGAEFNIANVGYGVSQVLPVAVELFARTRSCWFAIQQPEVHLHPKAQVALGEMFFALAASEEKKFLIETHSDYTIDSFRLSYGAKNVKKKPESQILFFERGREGNTLQAIDILENGEISEKQAKSFREFFIAHEMNLLRL